jgi:hypothetical protein
VSKRRAVQSSVNKKLPDDVKSRALKSSSLTLIKLANPVLLLAYVLIWKIDVKPASSPAVGITFIFGD